MNSDKQIQLYLERSLVGQELKGFRKKLKEDEPFRKLFLDYQKAWNLIEKQHLKLTLKDRLKERFGMSQYAISLDQIKEEVGIFSANTAPDSEDEKMLQAVMKAFMKRRFRNNRRIGFLLAIAASIILFIGLPVTFHLNQVSRTSALVYEQYFTPYPYLLHERSIPDDDSALDSKAMYFYNNRNYSEAAVIMEKNSMDSLPNPIQNLYLGVCYMEMKQYENAIRIFEDIISKDQNFTYNQARWFLGLTYLKLNKRSKATEQLIILQSDSCLYTKQAIEILKKLKQD